jgi:hypothetical protein
VSTQLSLLDAALVHADTGDDHQWLPGGDIREDIAAVLDRIPRVGYRHNTVREKNLRPLAYLYARTALLGPDERKVVQAIARKATGFVDEFNGYIPEMHDEAWIRLSGGAARDGREATRRVLPSNRQFAWGVAFLRSDAATPKVKAWREQVRPHLRAFGCDPGKHNHFLLPCLGPLILALRWSPAVEAAVFLAGSGVAPKSLAWDGLVDMALARGMPWSVPLAELSARHPRDVMSRAIAWVHAQGMQRRVVR